MRELHRVLGPALGERAQLVHITEHDPAPTAAPEAGPDAKYCLRIEITGSRLERILCLTREEWVDEEVDVDKEWAENGVRVIA